MSFVRAPLWLLPVLWAACTSSVDLAAARPYRCDRDAGTTCPGGWRCGLDEVCYQPELAGAVACSSDEDCASSWRCGRSGVCHQRGLGAPLACVADEDCEGQWRCGPELRCVDPSQDALRPSTPRGDFTFTRLNPPQTLPVPSAVAISVLAETDEQPVAMLLAWPGALLRASQGGVEHRALPPGTVTALASLGHTDYALIDKVVWRLVPDGGPVSSLGLSADDLRATGVARGEPPSYTQYTPEPLLLLLRSDGLAYLDPFGDGGVVRVLATDGGALEATEVWSMPRQPSDGCFVAATAEGLFSLRLERDVVVPSVILAEVSPIALPAIPHDGTVSVGRIRRSVVRWPYAMSVELSGTLVTYQHADSKLATTCQGVVQELTRVGGACEACPGGGVLVDFYPDPSDPNQAVHTRCRVQGDAGTTEALWLLSPARPACAPIRETTHSRADLEPVVVGRSLAGLRSLGGLNGHFWQLSTAAGVVGSALPLTQDSVPPHVSRAGGGLNLDGPLVVDSSLGLLSARAAGQPLLADVVGSPEWAVTPSRLVASVSDAGLRTVVPADPTRFVSSSGPARAALGPTGDGGLMAYFAQDDSLWTSELSAVDGAGLAPPLALRFNPAPKQPLRGLAPLPPGPAELAAAYVLSAQGLSRLSAAGANAWRVTDIALPEGEWVSLWADGARGRVLYRDGSVYALPSRVRVVAPLPGGGQAQDVTPLGDQVYLLASTGLFALAAGTDGGVTGSWSAVPLGSALVPGADFAGGKLHAWHHELTVFLSDGSFYRLTLPTP